MGKVVSALSMSLDGFVADEHGGVGELFGWYQNGDVEIPSADPRWTFHVTEASARFLRPAVSGAVGALICGRRLFERTDGWKGRHPAGCPIFVVSHTLPAGWPRDDLPVSFYPDAIAALDAAQTVAGERVVAVSTPTLTRQYLDAGLLDEITVSLIPVLLGEGISFFGGLTIAPIRLDGPEVIDGSGVTHLTYRVIR
ncbi:dihydrofolate reductase [Actinoplanes lutulentus]|uniref:Dihydrofolate reductase n=1 Tax=Actinoplanes lutulentus TaxID=1287878 RepID=A0A327ZH75_9ACTN|nr:dihydrofolate reductase family protein [Actinoplanes lutulentus]MBB2944547.1 dihydrofolate reductase [Actinoplanes lutulentus]RAK42222.1 dihydrofolate reductase [Actinoplanes lutulentus]